MTIPAWTNTGILPPYVGDNATSRGFGARSPYRTSLSALVDRFAINERRIRLLDGFLRYRQALHAEGLAVGLQWLDGSFVERVEEHRPEKRYPSDIDVVTLLPAPSAEDITERRERLFDPEYTKREFGVDAYPIEVGSTVELLVDDITYWFGLFSHRRETREWKGILEFGLAPDGEDSLRAQLSRLLEGGDDEQS